MKVVITGFHGNVCYGGLYPVYDPRGPVEAISVSTTAVGASPPEARIAGLANSNSVPYQASILNRKHKYPLESK